jgi:hypothetical protein
MVYIGLVRVKYEMFDRSAIRNSREFEMAAIRGLDVPFISAEIN